MRPNSAFLKQSESFWALVKRISEAMGYADRSGTRDSLKRYELQELGEFQQTFAIVSGTLEAVQKYLNYRARTLERRIQPLLMNRNEARKAFEALVTNYQPRCTLPFNKQKGRKRHLNYLTFIVNVLTEKHLKGTFNDSPRRCCLITDKRNRLVKVLSRWMDGAYPDVENPRAVWEVKEYYGTTTFGSRVADGVYESQLDGYEIREAERLSGRRIEHYLFVDDKFTWWDKGKSYLCRLLDMMHMGLVDEVIFGREVLTRWPQIVRGW